MAPVRYEVEPERIIGVGNKVFNTSRRGSRCAVKKGLRASLQSASLITGQQIVALDFVDRTRRPRRYMDGQDFVHADH